MARKEMKQSKVLKEIFFCSVVFFVLGFLDILLTLLADLGIGAVIFGLLIGVLEILIGFGLLKKMKIARITGFIFALIILVIAVYNIVNTFYTNTLYGYELSVLNLIFSIIQIVLIVLVMRFLSKNKNIFN